MESRRCWMAHDAGIDQGTLFEPTACNVFISNENFNSYKFAAQDICLLLLIHATTALWVVQVKKRIFENER